MDKRTEHTSRQFDGDIKEMEALLAVVNLAIHEMSQPVTVVLGLSELLLAKVNRNDPIVTDLTTIYKQVNRMSEIIKGIHRLSDEKPVSPIHQLNTEDNQ